MENGCVSLWEMESLIMKVDMFEYFKIHRYVSQVGCQGPWPPCFWYTVLNERSQASWPPVRSTYFKNQSNKEEGQGSWHPYQIYSFQEPWNKEENLTKVVEQNHYTLDVRVPGLFQVPPWIPDPLGFTSGVRNSSRNLSESRHPSISVCN